MLISTWFFFSILKICRTATLKLYHPPFILNKTTSSDQMALLQATTIIVISQLLQTELSSFTIFNDFKYLGKRVFIGVQSADICVASESEKSSEKERLIQHRCLTSTVTKCSYSASTNCAVINTSKPPTSCGMDCFAPCCNWPAQLDGIKRMLFPNHGGNNQILTGNYFPARAG